MYITPITFLEVSLRSSCADLHVGESLTVIKERTRAYACVRSLMTVRLSPTCRSAQDDLSDTSRNVIGVIYMAMTTCAVVYAV